LTRLLLVGHRHYRPLPCQCWE